MTRKTSLDSDSGSELYRDLELGCEKKQANMTCLFSISGGGSKGGTD